MAQVLPIAVAGQLVGSAVIVAVKDKRIFLATALHILGEGQSIQVALTPTGGDCSAIQHYPIQQIHVQVANIVTIDPFADLALIEIRPEGASNLRLPKIVNLPGHAPVGTDIVVLGYPFAPIGSVLETWTPGTITAVARRTIAQSIGVDELVLSNIAHPGSSGSAVIGKNDGILYGILRGSLAPPEVMKIGNIPVATDTSVTFATSAHLLHPLINSIRSQSEEV